MITLYANAKVNVGLKVVGVRDDGYHTIDTIMYPIYPLYDSITIEQNDEYVLTTAGLPIDCSIEENIITKVYRLFQEKYHISGAIITLEKHIPFGSGLGGGSSDATTVAKGLDALFHLHLAQQTLCQLVSEVGADCPFFVYNVPARCEGIGEKVTPIEPFLKDKYIALLQPEGIHISTREAYQHVTIGTHIPERHNVFENYVFEKFPLLRTLKEQLLQSGAYYASMTGSGATIYGLFNQRPTIDGAFIAQL